MGEQAPSEERNKFPLKPAFVDKAQHFSGKSTVCAKIYTGKLIMIKARRKNVFSAFTRKNKTGGQLFDANDFSF